MNIYKGFFQFHIARGRYRRLYIIAYKHIL